MHNHVRVCVVFVMVLGLGCARKPDEEMKAGQAALQRAREEHAHTHASELFARAQAAMQRGEQLLAAGHSDEAREAFAEAERLARQSIRESQATMDALRKREERFQTIAEEPAETTRHKVVRGECLWNIAGSPDVYNDPYQWPRIYNANRDQIADPDKIFPGQELTVHR